MSKQVQAEEQRFVDLHGNLNNFLQSTASNFSNADNFYVEYGAFLAELSSVFQGLKQFAADQAASHTQAQEQAKIRAAEHIKAVDEVNSIISAKRGELSTHQGTIQQAVNNLDSKAVAKLKVKETPALLNLFTNLYSVYYPEDTNAFDWTLFKKDAVEKQKLADFKARVINADYTRLYAGKVDAFEAAKNDADLTALAQGKKGVAPVAELLNIAQVVRSVATLQAEIAELQAKVDGLRAEAQTAEKAEAAEIEFARKRNEELAALNQRMIASAAPFESIEQRTAEARQAYESHKANLRNLISDSETLTRQIPESVYTPAN